MCLVFTNIFIKFFAVTANILHPRAVECAYARECQLWVNYYGQLREEHSEKNMCNNVQQCTFVYISEHFSFLNPLILAHRNAHRKTFFHIEKHFLKKHIFEHFCYVHFMYIFVHFCTSQIQICSKTLWNIFQIQICSKTLWNIFHFEPLLTFVEMFWNVLSRKPHFCTFQVHFDFTRNRACFSMFSMCIFPKMFFYVHFRHNKNNKNNKKTATLTTKMY